MWVRLQRNVAVAVLGAVFVLPCSSSRAGPRDYDGHWVGSIMCRNFTRSVQLNVSVENGAFGMQQSANSTGTSHDYRGRIGSDGGFEISGSLGGKGSLELQGRGKAGPTDVEARGMAIATSGGGPDGQRPCTITMRMVQPHPESIRGRELAQSGAGATGAGATGAGTVPAPLIVLGAAPDQESGGAAILQPSASSGAPAPSAPAPLVAQAAPAPPPAAVQPPPQLAARPPAMPRSSSSCSLDVAPVVAARASARKGAAFEAKPKLYVLSIGVSRYAEPSMNLSFAAKDACDLARALAGQQGGLYREVTVVVVEDEGATRDGVLDGLDWIVRETTSRDVAMVFLAGHGVNDATGEYFFLPHDADLNRLARSAIAQGDIRRSLMQVPGKALFFFDTCHSGQIMASRRALPPDVNRFVEALATAENSVIVFSASTGRQFAIEDPAWGNGAFTKALLEGIAGQADYKKDKVVTINELDLYLSERVKELTGGRQAPTTAKPASTQDFPIAIVR